MKAHRTIETHMPIRVQLKLLYSDRLNRYSCSDLSKLFIDALGAGRTPIAVFLNSDLIKAIADHCKLMYEEIPT